MISRSIRIVARLVSLDSMRAVVVWNDRSYELVGAGEPGEWWEPVELPR